GRYRHRGRRTISPCRARDEGAPASGGRQHRNGPPGRRLREGPTAGGVRLEDELARVVEVGWLNPVGVRGRKHDQLRLASVEGHVGLEPASDEHTKAVNRRIERGTRWRRLGL